MRHDAISRADVIDVPIAEIVVGERRRTKLGRLKPLATSIKTNGLIHPILLRGRTLVAGHRRLEACRSLDWKTIPARQVERLNDDQLRAIELDENTQREGLSDYETSKARLAQIRQAEADLKEKARDAELMGNVPKKSKSKRGRPKQSDSKQTVAEETGVSRRERERVERHVELAERYPFMQRSGWRRHHVLDAGDQIDKLPEHDRGPIAALLDQDAIPPAKVVEYLSHAVDMPAAQRRDVIKRAASADDFERRTALTMIAIVPPPVDPGLLALREATRSLERAADSCRSVEFRPRVTTLSHDALRLATEFSAHEKEARTNGSNVRG